MDQPALHQRSVTSSRFGDNARMNFGDMHYHLPHPAARAEVVRVIPYPRNEDLVHRPDLIDRLDKLLPQTAGSRSAALWGLGGSGKTQIALDYAYRRCDADEECCVFWVHADSEATFLADYKTIGKKLGVDKRLDGTDLLDAVRNEIEARPRWVIVLDNADDLRVFGVDQQAKEEEGTNDSLYKYVPCSANGTVLWTSRDAHIVGTLVGARRGIEVRSMATDEATFLLARIRDDPSMSEEAGVDDLLEELQCLPLAVSQAGAYMRRMSVTAKEYLSLLKQGKSRWEVLKMSDTDRHRRPDVSNSVLETWRISTERIRAESEMSYQILHVIAYVENQDIPEELMAAAASSYSMDDESSTTGAIELEVLEAITRLKEFSFLSLRRTEDGGRRYEMHKLVQEAIRYGLGIRGSMETMVGKASGVENWLETGEAYYSTIALQVVDGLFPLPEPTSWARCEQYMTHAIRVGEWAEVSGTEVQTSTLLERVSGFLYEQGRWREKEPVDSRAWDMRRKVLGEKHPDTIRSMAYLATTYHGQGRYSEAEGIYRRVLDLQREVLGEKHRNTIRSMANLAITYHAQGRYNEAEVLDREVLDLRRQVLGGKHPYTIKSMVELGTTYHAQGRYNEAEKLQDKALALQREVLGEKHPYTIRSMVELGTTYHAQGRYNEAKELKDEALGLRREVLGEKHPDTIWSMVELATTYHAQGRYNEAEKLKDKALGLRREVLGEKHPYTIWSMSSLAATYHAQGRYNEAEAIDREVLDLRRQVLGEKHPDTIRSMASLGTTYHAQGRYNEAEKLQDKALGLRREVLGEKHPYTVWSMAELGTTYHAQGRYNEAESIYQEVLDLRREVIGEKHPDTIRSMVELAATYHEQGRYDEALQLHQTALDLRRQVLGENHPDTMQSVAYLTSTREALQQLLSLVEPLQSLAVTQVHESEAEGKQRDRSLREVMHIKIGRFCKWISHKRKGFK